MHFDPFFSLFFSLFFYLIHNYDINERSDGVKREREVGIREEGSSFVSFEQREGRKGR